MKSRGKELRDHIVQKRMQNERDEGRAGRMDKGKHFSW